MQQSTKRPAQELLNTQLNAGDNHKQDSGKLIERIPIEKTPFWIVGNKEDGYRLIMGKYAITNKFPSIIDAEEYLNENQWEIILTMVIVVTKKMQEEENNIKKQQKVTL